MLSHMRQSELFTKTRREAPKDEVSKNAQLLVRAGYVHKEMAGVYSYLPLGLRVLRKIETIIREEMLSVGGQEVLMSSLQDPSVWKKTGRWDDKVVDNWFKTALKDGGELGLGHSHEEDLVRIMTLHASSYRDYPKAVFQIQNKFRNEKRAKSGILRGREFIMKDMYSFVRTEEELDAFHEKVVEAYFRVFTRAGIGDRTFRTFASGGSFSKFSDEFQMLCDAGEDVVYVDKGKKLAVNKEVYTDEVLSELGLDKKTLTEEKGIEVGNIFKLGTRFSEPLGLNARDEKGEEKPVLMGCYGIGLGRLMGAVVEALSDDKGIVWPASIAPFAAHLIEFLPAVPAHAGGEHADVRTETEDLYRELGERGIEVLLDDRTASAGEKFADSDLLGIPLRVVISQKSLAAGKFECTERAGGKTSFKTTSELLQALTP